jgi:hypothetical protein
MLPLLIAALNIVPSLLGGFSKAGLAIAPATPTPAGETVSPIETLVADIDTSVADVSNFATGQACVLGKFTEAGALAYVVTFKAGGPAAAALGL